MKMRTLILLVGAVCASWPLLGGVHEHAVYDSLSLNGEWEMAYSPYPYVRVDYPEFKGVRVVEAVPGYWEDMTERFRAAGLTDEFRINPWHVEQHFPIFDWADDTTLPQIYGCFFYRRTFEVDCGTDAAVLRFEGVRNQVHVWINGRFVKFRAGFSTPFELPIPKGVLRRGTNEIVLAVSNNPNLGYCDYVCGLTTRALFRSTGGVNGNLELRVLKSDLADVYVTTAADLKSFTVHVAGKDEYSYEIADGTNVLFRGSGKGDFTLPTDGCRLWSPENPYLYDLRLKTANGTFAQRFGLRRLVAAGEKFRLNGKPVYLRGVTEHCYFARTVHVPRDLGYYRMVTAKRKELGFNFVRFHTFVPPVEYLQATDELGMLVHIESPNFVSEPEYEAIIAFARTHPSVVIYCTGNETRIDRLAETYLEDIAGLVHGMTDALFSPMSAMRGVEYAVSGAKDDYVWKPFFHNPKRMARLTAYCDLFTSYQLGSTSYYSMKSSDPAELDAWGDAYLGKPRLSHEICIDGSYADLSLESMYGPESPILKTGIFSGIRRQLQDRGLIGRADSYFRNSCEWMRRVRKHCFEKLRAADRVAGYDFLGDINTHWHTFGYSVGMMDEFYRLKPGETVENVLRYNSAAVLLSDLGSDFNVTAGSTKTVKFDVSNYDREAADGRLTVRLVEADGGACVWEESKDCGPVPCGQLTRLAAVGVSVPPSAAAKKYLLQARLGRLAGNEWELYAFPQTEVNRPTQGVRVVSDISESDLAAAMAKGERVLLLGAGPFRSLPMTFRIGMAGRCSGDFATVIDRKHPALRGFPHEGFCGWQFRRLMEGGRSVQLEAGVPFDPIIDVASAVKCVIRQAALFEYAVGTGRLLVCALNFDEKDVAARWLKRCLESYVASDEFRPAYRLSPSELHAVVSAPLLSGTVNSNVARNPSDPASDVRANELVQP